MEVEGLIICRVMHLKQIAHIVILGGIKVFLGIQIGVKIGGIVIIHRLAAVIRQIRLKSAIIICTRSFDEMGQLRAGINAIADGGALLHLRLEKLFILLILVAGIACGCQLPYLGIDHLKGRNFIDDCQGLVGTGLHLLPVYIDDLIITLVFGAMIVNVVVEGVHIIVLGLLGHAHLRWCNPLARVGFAQVIRHAYFHHAGVIVNRRRVDGQFIFQGSGSIVGCVDLIAVVTFLGHVGFPAQIDGIVPRIQRHVGNLQKACAVRIGFGIVIGGYMYG